MKDAELIINADGSIYHLALLPSDIASTIISVGDPERVSEVSKHFDSIQVVKSKREFVTHTGYLRGKRISCISTGMGSDNIDIVMNELDALVNIDFKTRSHKKEHTALSIIRIGTSGSIAHHVSVDSLLCSAVAIGLEGLMLWYEQMKMTHVETAWMNALNTIELPIHPFVCEADDDLLNLFKHDFALGVTLTTAGFYAPQSRNLRLNNRYFDIIGSLGSLKVGDSTITNIEMETAAIYGMAKALGHKALSINAILAHRIRGEFSMDAQKTVDLAIQKTLNLLCR